MDAAKKPNVDDQWPANKLNAPGIVEALECFRPSGVAFFADEGLPWIEVHYSDIVEPGRVLPVGRAIQQAIQAPVLFQALRPNSICFVLDVPPGWLTKGQNDPRLPAGDYGVALEELQSAWQSTWSSMGTP